MVLATRCPQCGTTFRVVPDQIKVRGGLVRCGICSHVFDGSATLADVVLPPPARARADVPPLSLSFPDDGDADYPAVLRTRGAIRPSYASDDDGPIGVDALLAAPMPSEAADAAPSDAVSSHAVPSDVAPAGVAPFEIVPSAAAASSAPSRPQAPGAPSAVASLPPLRYRPATAPAAASGAAPAPALADADADASWQAPAMFTEERRANGRRGGSREEPQFSADSGDWPSGGATDGSREPQFNAAAGNGLDEPRLDASSGSGAPAFLDEDDRRKRRSRSGLWGVATLLVLLLLIGQAIWSFRDSIAANMPATRPALEKACALFGCRVGYLRDPARLSIESSSLEPWDAPNAAGAASASTPDGDHSDAAARSGPQNQGTVPGQGGAQGQDTVGQGNTVGQGDAQSEVQGQGNTQAQGVLQPLRRLALKVVLRNRGRVDQPWPAFELSLTDLSENVVARKVLLPSAYLAPQQLSMPLQAGAERAFRIPLDTVDTKAAGYRLTLFFP
jgi:predicted Zn finger-like uncharacterized protein